MVEVKLRVPEQVHKWLISQGHDVEYYQTILLNGLCIELEDSVTEMVEEIKNVLNDLDGNIREHEIIRERNGKLLIA